METKNVMPSQERPWMKYYPPGTGDIVIPKVRVLDYLLMNCPGEDFVAMHYYGRDITWKEFLAQIDRTAKALKAAGFNEGDYVPVFLRSVPEYLVLLFAAEKIGAKIVSRDNTPSENAEAVLNSGKDTIFCHDFISEKEVEAFVKEGFVKKIILVDPLESANNVKLRRHIRQNLYSYYDEAASDESKKGLCISWNDFLAAGDSYEGEVEVVVDCDRPLLCAYTSGSTGASKQVIHSAYSIIGAVHQMNFWGAQGDFRPTWLLTQLPPSLIAVVVSMMLMPLASNKILILDPFVKVEDLDLELMHYRPNCWPLIPMFIEVLIRSERIPEDYDVSHLMSAGAGSEAFNNSQMRRTQKFLADHKSQGRVTAGYGSSEAGSGVCIPMSPHPIGNGNVGIPLPLTTIGIFKPGTTEELPYNTLGEICISGPGVMLGYDNKEATEKAIKIHEDGNRWLHMGDIGYMNADGVLYMLTRGYSPRYGFENATLDILPMENVLADAEIPGIDDEFFVVMPDREHPGYFVPYLYVSLDDGYQLEDVEQQIHDALEPHMIPMQIFEVDERPFWHYKTARILLMNELAADGL